MKYKYINLSLIFFMYSTFCFSQPGQEYETQPCEIANPIGYDIKPDHVMLDYDKPSPNPPTASSPPDDDSHRIIYWLHGLGGDPVSWSGVGADIQLNYKAISTFPNYPEFDLFDSGLLLHNNLIIHGTPFMDEDADHEMNFIIAHSLGGMVARSAHYYETLPSSSGKEFGGIVTFGTPHQGAELLANADLINDFTNDACIDLTAGPIKEAFEGNWFLDLITDSESISFQQRIDNTCNFLSDEIVPIFIADLTSPISEDLVVGASDLDELNDFVPAPEDEIKTVAFVGIEQNPVSWRTAQYFINKPEEFVNYTCGSDEELVTWANNNQSGYQAKYDLYADLVFGLYNYDNCTFWNFIFDPTTCAAEAIADIFVEGYNFGMNQEDAILIRDAYHQGLQWWINEDNSYKALIGAVELVEGASTYECTCITEDYYGNQDEDIDIVNSLDDCDDTDCWVSEEYIHYVYSDIPSDGVVLAESAANYPGVNKVVEMMGSNHQQMRNDNNTKDALELLMEGMHGDWFETPHY